MSALALISEFSELGIKARPNGRDIALVSPRGVLTPDLVKRIKAEKPGLLRELKKLQREAGEDWGEIANDPAQLKAFAELLMIVEMREKGICPAHYIGTTHCKHCGVVPIWDGCPSEVQGCSWCLNRHRGLPIPRAKDND